MDSQVRRRLAGPAASSCCRESKRRRTWPEPYRLEQHLHDSGRVRSELGYADPIPVDEALRRTAEWERANPPRQIDPAKFDYAAEDEAIARVMT